MLRLVSGNLIHLGYIRFSQKLIGLLGEEETLPWARLCNRLHSTICIVLLSEFVSQKAWLQQFLCPWDSPSKNTGVGFRACLQGPFLTQGWSPHLLCHLHLPLVPLGKPDKHLYMVNILIMILYFEFPGQFKSFLVFKLTLALWYQELDPQA